MRSADSNIKTRRFFNRKEKNIDKQSFRVVIINCSSISPSGQSYEAGHAGRTFIVNSITEIVKTLDKGGTSIKSALKELDEVGLLEQKRVGFSAAYSDTGINKLRDLTNEKDCRFVLWVGNKRLIKRRLFDQFIEQMDSI